VGDWPRSQQGAQRFRAVRTISFLHFGFPFKEGLVTAELPEGTLQTAPDPSAGYNFDTYLVNLKTGKKIAAQSLGGNRYRVFMGSVECPGCHFGQGLIVDLMGENPAILMLPAVLSTVTEVMAARGKPPVAAGTKPIAQGGGTSQARTGSGAGRAAGASAQLELFPELGESAPSRPLVAEPTSPVRPGSVPHIDVAEIKSAQSESAGWRQINTRKYRFKIPDSGHEAVVTYDAEGNVRAKVRISGGDEKVIFDKPIGKIPKDQMPTGQYGTNAFGDAIEDPIRQLLEERTGQKFLIKKPSATGPDILPHQLTIPAPH
jgi:hypothetical protein